MKKKKIWLTLIIILIIAGGIYYKKYYTKKNDKKENIQTTTEIKRGDIAVYVNSSGIIEPNFTVEIKSKASGEIIKLPFEEGDIVKKGDLLIELDPSDENRNVTRAEADLKKVEADLQIAKSNLIIEKNSYQNSIVTATSNLESAKISYEDSKKKSERSEELYKEKLISTEAYENAKKDFIIANAKYEQAVSENNTLPAKFERIKIYENNIKSAEVALIKSKLSYEEAVKRRNETKIFSPIDGIVLSRNVSFGQIISSATSNVGGGSLLLNIADITKMYVIADVDESDIGKVKLGQKVSLTVDAYRDKTFSGIIERIRPEGKTESNITVFKVKINIDDEKRNLLLAGMTANIQIEIEKAEDILYVPFQSVRTRNGRSMLFIENENNNDTEPIRIPIKIGVTDGENVEIISDKINEGDKVLLNASARRTNETGQTQRARDPNRELRRMMR